MPKTSKIGKRLNNAKREQLERALCTIVDNGRIIADALGELGEHESNMHVICRALRLIVVGEA